MTTTYSIENDYSSLNGINEHYNPITNPTNSDGVEVKINGCNIEVNCDGAVVAGYKKSKEMKERLVDSYIQEKKN